MTFFAVAMFACNYIVVFSLFYHNNFVDTSFACSGNRSNVKGNIIAATTSSLTSITGIIYSMVGMMFIMMSTVVISMVSCCAIVIS